MGKLPLIVNKCDLGNIRIYCFKFNNLTGICILKRFRELKWLFFPYFFLIKVLITNIVLLMRMDFFMVNNRKFMYDLMERKITLRASIALPER